MSFTSLVKLIPRYFIVLDNYYKLNCFLDFLFGLLTAGYRNTTDILYIELATCNLAEFVY